MYKIVFVRHGESEWNKKDIFCGWYDAPLSVKGRRDSIAAGRLLKKEKYSFDHALASPLRRASDTLKEILRQMKLSKIPTENPWQLLERHYGDLTGKNKAQTLKRFGEEKFMKWRRGYNTPPPPISDRNRFKKSIKNNPNLAGIKIPATECLADVVKRVLPYWKKQIVPKIKQGQKIIIAGHGNALRAIIKYLDKVPPKEIVQLNLPTGIPLVYELDSKLKPIRHYYLGDPKKVQAAIDAVKNQGRKK